MGRWESLVSRGYPVGDEDEVLGSNVAGSGEGVA
jgi:hypothetical protein